MSVAVMAVAVLAGWVLGIEAFTRVAPGLATMKFNTALCLLLSAIALLFRELAIVRVVCAALVVVVAELTFRQHLGGADSGIDQWLWRDLSTDGHTPEPGRMSPVTAVAFLLLGPALLLLGLRRRSVWLISEWLALSVTVIGAVATLGYLFSVEQLYRLPGFGSVAVHTALSFVLLGIGTLCALPHGVAHVFVAPGAGGLLARRTLPAVLGVPVLAGWLVETGIRAGLFGDFSAVAILSTATILALGVVISLSAYRLEALGEQRRRAEEHLSDTQAELETLIAAAPVGFCYLDRELRFLRINERLAEMNGRSVAEHLGRTVAETVPSVLPLVQEVTARILATGEPVRDVEFEGETPLLPGVKRYWNEHWYPVRGPSGEIAGFGVVVEEITARKHAAADAARLAAIVSSSSDAILSLTLDGTITSWNDGAAALFGYSAEEMIGQSIRRLIPSERQVEEDDILVRLKAGESITHYETVRLKKDGSHADVSLTISPMKERMGAITGISKIIRDITARKQAEAALREAKEKAETASRAKDRFLAQLSHELRTPLTPALMIATMLKSDPRLDAEIREDITVIVRNIELEARLIDDLLDVTRISNGKLTLRAEACDLHAVIELAAGMVGEEAREKGVALEIAPHASESALKGDPARLQQVFWNLLRNAVKFTPAGGHVAVRTYAPGSPGGDGARATRLAVEVRDTGIGFDPAAAARIFEPFEQEVAGARSGQGGLGLGLAIARGIVELHRGSIRAESDGVGRGAVFVVELPVEK